MVVKGHGLCSLGAKGKVMVKVKIAFVADDGVMATKTVTVTLVKKGGP